MFPGTVRCIGYFACALFVTANAPAQAPAEKTTVLATVQSLLDGWREADAGKVDSALHQDFREVTLHLQEDGKWASTVVDRAKLVGTVAKIPKDTWDDRLTSPQVHVDGPIAVVWSRYKFAVHYVEDSVAHAPVHCGVETFQLYKTDTGWKIINFADTHSDKCP